MQIAPQNFIHDPYILEFLNLKDYPSLRESSIETALISNLQEFLLELGKGFCFVARQKLMRYEEEDFVFFGGTSINRCRARPSVVAKPYDMRFNTSSLNRGDDF